MRTGVDRPSRVGLELGARDYELLRKVGRYYLQYEGVVDLEGLLLGPRGTRPLPADEATLAYLRYYALHLAVGAAVEAAEAALRDRLVSRELSVEYSEEPVGVAGVELTMNVHHLGLAAYYTYRLGLNAPEHAVMGCLLRRVYALASRLRRSSGRSDAMFLNGFIRNGIKTQA